MSNSKDNSLTTLLFKVGAGVVILIVGIILIANMVTTVSADEIVIKQDAISGQLHVWNEPGVHWQNFGTITRYKRSAQFWFSHRKDEGKDIDESIKVRFNDGGHGNISGSLRYSLPTDPNKMLVLHKTYHSMSAIDHELIQQVVNKSVFMSGPLMSSRESYAEKRADLISYITDQIQYGVYRTEHDQNEIKDPLTGEKKTVDIVRPKQDPHSPNGIAREEDSPLERFGVQANNITINNIEYDPTVEAQIKQQQEAIMAVQQAIVNAKKAEQDAITTEQQGKASAAKAKWDQEVVKATAVTSAEKDKAVAVTQAEKDKDVAALNLQTTQLNAQATVTEAKANADAKRLSMQADNYQAKKIDATVEIQKAWAAAYGAQRQTPDIQMGGSGSSPAGGTQTLIDLIATKTAQQMNK